jgi:hypothetical protein
MGYRIVQYTIEELTETVSDFLVFNKTNNKEIDFIVGKGASKQTKEFLYSDLIKTLVFWHFHLKNCVVIENYELADKIKQIISIENNNFLAIIKSSCIWFSKKEDKQLIIEINHEIKEIYSL